MNRSVLLTSLVVSFITCVSLYSLLSGFADVSNSPFGIIRQEQARINRVEDMASRPSTRFSSEEWKDLLESERQSLERFKDYAAHDEGRNEHLFGFSKMLAAVMLLISGFLILLQKRIGLWILFPTSVALVFISISHAVYFRFGEFRLNCLNQDVTAALTYSSWDLSIVVLNVLLLTTVGSCFRSLKTKGP